MLYLGSLYFRESYYEAVGFLPRICQGSFGCRVGEGRESPTAGTWHASPSLSKSHRLNTAFGRKTFSRQQLKDRGPSDNPVFTGLAAPSSLAHPPLL